MYILIGSFAVILIAYIVLVLCADKNIVFSKRVKTTGKIKADMFYYLPSAALQVSATATVVVVRTVPAEGNPVITSALLQSVAIQPVVSIVPDTDYLFTLCYKPSPFMNDEIRLTAGPTGLLQTISTTTEDRISNIINEAAAVPGNMLTLQAQAAMAALPSTDPAKTSTTVTYTNTFFVPPEKLKEGSADFHWVINTDGTINELTNADASFRIEFQGVSVNASEEINDAGDPGVYTRPLKTILFKVSPKGVPNGIQAEIQIPDYSRLVNIPVTRTPFVKKINTPKFTNGMITENYIDKPSEIEGFQAIPINIGKALFAMPAQLFNFKIQHQNQNRIAELTMEAKIATLKKQAGQTVTGTNH